jgi:hypothetical protein
MAPGRWNAPGENDTVAVASGAVHCGQSQIAPTRSASDGARDLRATGTWEQGE